MPELRKILLDTNFLLLPGQYKVDIFSELERICDFSYSLYILDKAVDELEKIILKGNLRDRISANVAKGLIKSKKINIIKSMDGVVDDLILEYAKKNCFVVATVDIALKKRLKNDGIKTITLRKRKYLIFD